jgi:hypothetical protein
VQDAAVEPPRQERDLVEALRARHLEAGAFEQSTGGVGGVAALVSEAAIEGSLTALKATLSSLMRRT